MKAFTRHEQTIRAVITRADGTVEDLGIISYYSRNPFRRWSFAARQFLRRILS